MSKTIRVSNDYYERIERFAHEGKRGLGKQIEVMFDDYMERKKEVIDSLIHPVSSRATKPRSAKSTNVIKEIK